MALRLKGFTAACKMWNVSDSKSAIGACGEEKGKLASQTD